MTTRGASVHQGLERKVLTFTLAAGLPALIAAIVLLWTTVQSFEVRWGVALLLVTFYIAFASAARRETTRVLMRAAGLLGALREGDYSIRSMRAPEGTATQMLMTEIDALGDTLQRQRLDAVESIALLSNVMQAIDVALLAFDENEHLVLVNPAGEGLLSQPLSELVGSTASELGVEEYLGGQVPRLVQPAFAPPGRRFEVRRSTFRREGRRHILLMLADVSRALREEEQIAWQRIVRVLSHEINNSLTPIKSIAHTLHRILSRVPELDRQQEVLDALALIETRSGTLGRFLRAYAQLAKLPAPDPQPIDLMPVARRVAELEDRLKVEIHAADNLHLNADPDQLEQLLINLVRNAADAAVETGGRVWIDWSHEPGAARIVIEDEGKGLPETANLFVPFFTTKPAGSGIGLVLCRQIAEAHGGTLALERRNPAPGTRAILRLPASLSQGPRRLHH